MLAKILTAALARLAQAVLRKYQPKIIAITGSVGKTTARVAVAVVVAARYRVGTAKKNYNNELGVPLTLLGMEAPGRSVYRWLRIFAVGWGYLWQRDSNYPEWLVLEFGADHPGDIAYLLRLAPPNIGVLTAVSAAHTEFFSSVAGVLAEKKLILTALPETSTAIFNSDSELISSVRSEIKAPITTYGWHDATITIKATSLHLNEQGKTDGMMATIIAGGEEQDIFIPGVVGQPVVYSVAAAVAVGQALGLTWTEIRRGLENFQSPAGRLRLLAGIKNTEILDDTYNSSPAAAAAALAAFSLLQGERHIAVLGDMLELGGLSDEEHRKLGRQVTATNCDVLLTVGAGGVVIAGGAKEAGLSADKIFSFDNAASAGRFLQEMLRPGDVVLVKGSQGKRMEKVVKEIMAEPERAEELLVRHDVVWLEK